MNKTIRRKFTLVNFILLTFLMAAGCLKLKPAESAPVEESGMPYDYDVAAAKLKEHCGSFPTSFGTSDDSIYTYDLTGDGTDDLCTFVFFGSGMPRTDIVLFDVAEDKFYTLDGFDLRGAYGYDYRILSVEEYGVVISERQFYPEEHAAKFGLLTFEDGNLGMDEFDVHSSEYALAKELYTK